LTNPIFLAPAFRRALVRRAVVLAALLAGVSVVSMLAAWHWLAELTVHFAPHYLVASLVLGAVLGLGRRWVWALLCAGVLALNLWRVWPYLESPSVVEARSGPEAGIRVLQWNVNFRNRDPEPALAWILEREMGVDVVVLLEVTHLWRPVLDALARFYPHSLIETREDNFGIAVFSRLPDSDLRLLTHRGSGLPSVLAIGSSPAGEIFALWAVHPPPPVGPELAALRNRQIATLIDALRDPAMPMLVAGDLNMTPWSPWFARLVREAGLRDSGAGRGVRPTWAPAPVPAWLGLPVDHLLGTPEFRVLARELGPRMGSDHRPLVTEMILESR
jgi:endonuclease/exonuclease/phosphatase (EEP) superfamily protein YafD